MRLYALLAAVGLALAAGPAFAACGSPQAGLSVSGQSFVGVTDAAMAGIPPQSAVMAFAADCTVSQTLGNGGKRRARPATWSQAGDVVTIERTTPGQTTVVRYVGKVGAAGMLEGRWGATAELKGAFALTRTADPYPCGAPGPAGSLAGTTFLGEAVDMRGVSVPLSLDLNTNCSLRLGGAADHGGSWKQEGDRIRFKTAGRGWNAASTGKTLVGSITLLDDAGRFALFIAPSDLTVPATPAPPVAKGAKGGTFALTRQD